MGKYMRTGAERGARRRYGLSWEALNGVDVVSVFCIWESFTSADKTYLNYFSSRYLEFMSRKRL